MSLSTLTDDGLRETLNELRKAKRLDHEERERLIRIAGETETRIHALGTRMMAADLVIEAVEAELSERRRGAADGAGAPA